jgi:ribosomal protein S18 acetylase RimI-like enzyme
MRPGQADERASTGLAIRIAMPDDLPQIAACDEQWRNASRRLHIEQAVLELRCWVAVDADVCIGYGLLIHGWFCHPFIQLLVVHPQRRCQGVGTALLGHLMSTCADDRIFTSTNRSNTPMQQLLDRHGFEPAGEVRYLEDEHDPELVFVRRIASPGEPA